MAFSQHNASTDSTALAQIWDAEWGLNPTEETKIADWVQQPVGAQKFGNILNLRKLMATPAVAYTSSANAGQRANLTFDVGVETTVTAQSVGKYVAVGFDRAVLNRAINDSNLRSGMKTQMMAGLNEGVDISLFALCSSLSITTSQADFDDAMTRTALGLLATNAKGKFNENSAKLLVVHPVELKNVWNIPAIKEYQIRGKIGAAVDAQLNAYGLVWRESGNVLFSLGSYYNPLLLKDAWALAWNEKPHIFDVQMEGLTENWIAYEEYGVCEWFDSSGVACITT